MFDQYSIGIDWPFFKTFQNQSYKIAFFQYRVLREKNAQNTDTTVKASINKFATSKDEMRGTHGVTMLLKIKLTSRTLNSQFFKLI